MFVDFVTIDVAAGDGGAGAISFHREKFVDRGGPDGGDGGNGGDVVLVASRRENALAKFRFEKQLKAQDGQAGGKNNRHGRSGDSLIVPVPVGTSIINGDQLVADLTEEDQSVTVAAGGKGGFGNAHFVSSTRQAPKFAEKGEPGEKLQLKLELKLIADVGLIGLPNAGKSTLLSRLSNARPKIANYPFTTLEPKLGVVDSGKTSLLLADIPGLIEGAAEGKGLGHEFLRHVERTAALLHLVDVYEDDPVGNYRTIRAELAGYGRGLDKLPEIVVLTKAEGMAEADLAKLKQAIQAEAGKKTPVVAISSQSGLNLDQLVRAAEKLVSRQRQKETKRAKKAAGDLPIISLESTADAWQVEQTDDGWLVTGQKIERFAARTDFTNDQAVARLRDIMRKTGIIHELERRGIQAGQAINIGPNSFKY